MVDIYLATLQLGKYPPLRRIIVKYYLTSCLYDGQQALNICRLYMADMEGCKVKQIPIRRQRISRQANNACLL